MEPIKILICISTSLLLLRNLLSSLTISLSTQLLLNLLSLLFREVSLFNFRPALLALPQPTPIALRQLPLHQFQIFTLCLVLEFKYTIIGISIFAKTDCASQEARVRDYGNDFFFARVQRVQAGLAAGDGCTAGEGIRAGLGGPEGVDGGVVDVWEEGFHVGERAARVAGFVGVFWEGLEVSLELLCGICMCKFMVCLQW